MRLLKSVTYHLTSFILGVAIACGVSPAVADIVQNTIYNLGSTVVIASDGSSTSYFRWAKDIWAYAQTADGADNGTINIAGGGGVASQGRGGYIIVRGNEASNGAITIAQGSNGGGINTIGSIAPTVDATDNLGAAALAYANVYTNNIRSSSVSAPLNLRATGAQDVNIYSNGSARWTIHGTTGAFMQDGTSGGGIIMPRALNTTSTLILGQSAAVADQPGAALLVSSDVATNIQAIFQQSTADANGVFFDINKTRKTNFTADTIVVSGDTIGQIRFRAADGVSFRDAAAIVAKVDGTPGSSDMPGSIDFQTSPDGSATLASVLKLDNAKKATFTGQLVSSAAADLGWTPVNAANQACNTTCTSACVFGMNTGALGNFVSCSDATADTCICAGAS